MNTTELRAVEMAIEKTLQSDFYDADRTEIDNFINSVRLHIHGKVRITEGAGDNITVVLPSAISMPEKIHPTAKRMREAKEAKEDA